MKPFITSCTILVFAVLFYGCSLNTEDTEEPTFTVASPTENSIYNNGDEVDINITFIDNEELRQVNVMLVDETHGDTLLNYEDFPTEALFGYSTFFTLDVEVPADLTLSFSCEDGAGNPRAGNIQLKVQ